LLRATGEPTVKFAEQRPTDNTAIFVYDGGIHQGTGTRKMRKFVIVALMIALLPVSAYAQKDKGPLTARTEKEMKDDKEIDKAYQDTMKRTKDNGQASRSDPWQTIRPPGTDNTKR
jgi:hypothetical protein